MSLDKDLEDIFSLLGRFLSSVGLKPAPKRVKKQRKQFNTSGSIKFQSPIKSSWVNLGDFLPGKYINETHKGGHYGIDMAAQRGTAVYPFAQGVVQSAGQSSGNTLGGITITLLHPNGMMTYYAHLSSVSVDKGDAVSLSTQIGSVGNTGNAAGGPTHLHFELHQNVDPKNPGSNWNGTAINPASYFSVPPYSKMQNGKTKNIV